MTAENIDYSDIDAGKRISIEPGTPLQIEIGGIAFRFKSILIGMEPDKFLIMKTPIVPGDAPFGMIKHKLFRGNDVIVRYLCGGTVFGFQSKLIEAIFDPVKLLFVEYPKIVEHHDLRSQKRVDCLLLGRIEINDGERQGFIVDINEKGCRCRIKRQKDEKLPNIQIDDQITLRFKFLGVEAEHVISGEIKNISRDNDEVCLGIGFYEIDTEVQNIITQYILAIKDLS